jgi:hypothetical protein
MDTGYAPKNNFKPKIIKGFFTEKELTTILEIVENQKNDKEIDKFYQPFVIEKMSRMQIEVIYPKEIKEKLESFASEIVGEKVLMHHNSYLSYNLKHGKGVNPSLPPHYDSDNFYSKLTMDYQLNKNIDWVIRIEEEEFNLEFGDLLIFWGAGNVHWRDPILFKDEDNTEVLTMHFSTMEDHLKLNSISRTQEARDKRMSIWNERLDYTKYKTEYDLKEKLLKIKNKQKI